MEDGTGRAKWLRLESVTSPVTGVVMDVAGWAAGDGGPPEPDVGPAVSPAVPGGTRVPSAQTFWRPWVL